eukprot:1121792-Prorocentrum_minimum.AAC.1
MVGRVTGELVSTLLAHRYTRGALGAAADEISANGVRCPHHPGGCDTFLGGETLRRLVGVKPTADGAAYDQMTPLTSEEVDRCALN